VKGIFQRIGESTIIPPKFAGKVTQTIGVNLGWERSKNIRIMRQFWKPGASVSEMEAFHKRYQNKQTGRIGWVSQHDIGRWKVQDQMWVSNSSANQYFKKLADRVGYTKAGWVKAAIRVGLHVASYVRRHESYAGGGYQAPTPSNLNITAENYIAKIPNYATKHVEPAVRSRVRSLASELARLLKGGKTRRKSLFGTPSNPAPS
jgi:hypothetical protein